MCLQWWTNLQKQWPMCSQLTSVLDLQSLVGVFMWIVRGVMPVSEHSQLLSCVNRGLLHVKALPGINWVVGIEKLMDGGTVSSVKTLDMRSLASSLMTRGERWISSILRISSVFRISSEIFFSISLSSRFYWLEAFSISRFYWRKLLRSPRLFFDEFL